MQWHPSSLTVPTPPGADSVRRFQEQPCHSRGSMRQAGETPVRGRGTPAKEYTLHRLSDTTEQR